MGTRLLEPCPVSLIKMIERSPRSSNSSGTRVRSSEALEHRLPHAAVALVAVVVSDEVRGESHPQARAEKTR